MTVLAMALLAALIALCAYIKPAETLPGGFSDVKVTDAHLPTALAFTPDGRMVVAGKSGQVYLYDRSGNNLAKPEAMELPVCDNSERGLLGMVDRSSEPKATTTSTSTTLTRGPRARSSSRPPRVTRTSGSRGSRWMATPSSKTARRSS